jgi:hypothetical protein
MIANGRSWQISLKKLGSKRAGTAMQLALLMFGLW